MKLAPKLIDAWLREPQKNSVSALLYGPDAGLVHARARAIIARLLPDANDPFALTEYGEDGDPAALADALLSPSLLGGARVVHVRGGDKIAAAVEAALPHARADAYLLVSAGELGPKSGLRKLFENAGNAMAVACYKDEGMDLESAIRRRLESHSLNVTRDGVVFLATQLGNDAQVTCNEIDKIALYAGEEKTLSLETLSALTGASKDATFDQLANALADRNVAALTRQLQQMQMEGVSPVAILRAGLRYFHRLYALHTKMESGTPLEEAIGELRPPVFFKQVPVLKRHAQQWKPSAIVKVLARLNQAETQCKQGVLPADTICNQALLSIAGSPRASAA